MNKRELKKWLENEKEEKVKKLREEYDKTRNAMILTQLQSCGVTSLVEKAISLGEDAEVWLENYGKKFGAYKYGYTKLAEWARLNKTPSELLRKLISEIDCSELRKNNKEFMELHKKYEEARFGVDNTYTALIANLTVFKTSKEAVEYLKELGLEVPDDNRGLCTAVMVPVDTRYLFLDKETM